MNAQMDPSGTSGGLADAWRRLEVLTENSSDVVYEADPQGMVTWVSPSAEQVFGRSADSLLGTRAFDLLHPSELPAMVELRRMLFATGDSAEGSVRVRAANGAYRLCKMLAKPIMDANGQITGSRVALRDVHEAEARLRAVATLSDGNRVLVRALNEESLLQSMCETLTREGRYAFAWYGRRGTIPDRRVIPIAEAPFDFALRALDIRWDSSPQGAGPTGRAMRTGETQLLDHFEPTEGFPASLQLAKLRGFECCIALPVVVDEEVDGALVVYATEPYAFDAQAREILEVLAADLGYGLAKLRREAELREAFTSSVHLLSEAVDTRDPYTAGHQWRVSQLAGAIAECMELPAHSVQGIKLGASIHDVGKIAVPRSLLTKRDPVTPEERALLRSHVETGARIAARFPWPWPIAAMIEQHHERLDGSGYPAGLRGDEILMEARIIAVADTYEAMSMDRPYRIAPGAVAALEVLHEGRDTLFDSEVLDALDVVLAEGFDWSS